MLSYSHRSKSFFPGERKSEAEIIFTINDFGDFNLKGNSRNWKCWQCQFTPKTCIPCMEKHGAIYPYNATIKELHPNGFCRLVRMRTKQAGTVTKKGISGADAYLKYTGTLPKNYIDKDTAKQKGWVPRRGNLADVLPGAEIGGDVFYNSDEKLPVAIGRIWYEADFDYYGGYRNDNRILYSSDGLIFISYDHYKTFYELI